MTMRGVSFYQETERRDGITEHFKFEQAYIAALVLGKVLNADDMIIHPLCVGAQQKSEVYVGAR